MGQARAPCQNGARRNVWVLGKVPNAPAYAHWTRGSARITECLHPEGRDGPPGNSRPCHKMARDVFFICLPLLLLLGQRKGLGYDEGILDCDSHRNRMNAQNGACGAVRLTRASCHCSPADMTPGVNRDWFGSVSQFHIWGPNFLRAT